MNFSTIISVFWIIFIAYWLVSAIGVKKNVKRSGAWARSAGIRLVFIIIILVFFSVLYRGYNYNNIFIPSPAVQVIGVALSALGIAFAIWARVHLGRDWSGIPSMKEGHELVTSGPYRFVRHPIYTGILLAIFGSALVGGVFWIIVFIVSCVTFLYRIPVEEGFMMQLFPNTYPDYKKRTKALIPFVW
jgi:protein-S-isoprenylcysteine O-methyltransferase Ste14